MDQRAATGGDAPSRGRSAKKREGAGPTYLDVLGVEHLSVQREVTTGGAENVSLLMITPPATPQRTPGSPASLPPAPLTNLVAHVHDASGPDELQRRRWGDAGVRGRRRAREGAT